MKTEQVVEEIAASLLEFVKRASREGAAPAEVKALPETARVLFEVCKCL